MTVEAAWLRARHPELARNLEQGTPKRHTPARVSADSATPPKLPGLKRDFGGLKPSSVARHKIAKEASEHEAMAEQPVEAHPASRPGRMSNKAEPSPLRLRDMTLAHSRATLGKEH